MDRAHLSKKITGCEQFQTKCWKKAATLTVDTTYIFDEAATGMLHQEGNLSVKKSLEKLVDILWLHVII